MTTEWQRSDFAAKRLRSEATSQQSDFVAATDQSRDNIPAIAIQSDKEAIAWRSRSDFGAIS
jgi:hypothetical protein